MELPKCISTFKYLILWNVSSKIGYFVGIFKLLCLYSLWKCIRYNINLENMCISYWLWIFSQYFLTNFGELNVFITSASVLKLLFTIGVQTTAKFYSIIRDVKQNNKKSLIHAILHILCDGKFNNYRFSSSYLL